MSQKIQAFLSLPPKTKNIPATFFYKLYLPCNNFSSSFFKESCGCATHFFESFLLCSQIPLHLSSFHLLPRSFCLTFHLTETHWKPRPRRSFLLCSTYLLSTNSPYGCVLCGPRMIGLRPRWLVESPSRAWRGRERSFQGRGRTKPRPNKAHRTKAKSEKAHIKPRRSLM